MQLKDQKKPYSLSIMEKYCKDNIDIYYVEPIIREAFYEGLISPEVAYIHLRVAQMEESEGKITGKQIAEEVGISPSVIVKYKKDRMLGITQKKYIQLLLKTHPKDMLSLWEKSNFNQALADYVNKYKAMRITNGEANDLQKEEYELKNEITKDVCRKIYRELVQDRIRAKRDISDDIDWIISINVISCGKKITVEIQWVTVGEERKIELEYPKENFVHGIVYKMQNIIGGVLSGKDNYNKVYLKRCSNRKVCLAMEYIAMTNNKVYLI